jgi:radical SAM protein with 4Fe4S-binding SPASM domain
MKTKVDHTYRFVTVFDPKTGFSVRSDVIDKQGNYTGKDPFMAEFPELLDIGIMGHCRHGLSGLCASSKVECYQSGDHIVEPNMPIEKFREIIEQCRGKTFQVALGGRGDPDQHEDFEEILKICSLNEVVPNLTSSGIGLDDYRIELIKKHCGAAAISWYRQDYTLKAIQRLIDAGVKTNIHYVISNATIDEAIMRMENDLWPKGINRIIFLLHKPVGLGSQMNVLNAHDPKVQKFFNLFNIKEHIDKAGFDSCCVPGLLSNTTNIDIQTIEPCEAGRFSAYITPDSRLYPCSFEKDDALCIDLSEYTIEEAWNSEKLKQFRNRYLNKCMQCKIVDHCYGGCPILRQINTCKERNEVLI